MATRKTTKGGPVATETAIPMKIEWKRIKEETLEDLSLLLFLWGEDFVWVLRFHVFGIERFRCGVKLVEVELEVGIVIVVLVAPYVRCSMSIGFWCGNWERGNSCY
jgi:hypothetical protein